MLRQQNPTANKPDDQHEPRRRGPEQQTAQDPQGKAVNKEQSDETILSHNKSQPVVYKIYAAAGATIHIHGSGQVSIQQNPPQQHLVWQALGNLNTWLCQTVGHIYIWFGQGRVNLHTRLHDTAKRCSDTASVAIARLQDFLQDTWETVLLAFGCILCFVVGTVAFLGVLAWMAVWAIIYFVVMVVTLLMLVVICNTEKHRIRPARSSMDRRYLI